MLLNQRSSKLVKKVGKQWGNDPIVTPKIRGLYRIRTESAETHILALQCVLTQRLSIRHAIEPKKLTSC